MVNEVHGAVDEKVMPVIKGLRGKVWTSGERSAGKKDQMLGEGTDPFPDSGSRCNCW